MLTKPRYLSLRVALIGVVLMGCALLGRTAFVVVRREFAPNVSESTMRQNLLTAQEVEAWHPGLFRPADKTTEVLTKYQTQGNDVQVGAMYVWVDMTKEPDRLANKRLYHDVSFVADEQAGTSEFEYQALYAFIKGDIPNHPIPEVAPNADQSAMGCIHTSFVKSCKVVLRYKDHVETLKLTVPASATIEAESITDLVKIIDARPLNQRK